MSGTTKMSIHKGLAELKLLDSRIEKVTTSLIATNYAKEGEPVQGHFNRNDFEETAKKGYQSVTDLISRKIKIKSAIVKANAETIVTVGEQKMSIADAITYRGIIQMKHSLVIHLKRNYGNTMAKIELYNGKVDRTAIELAEKALGAESNSKKDIESITGPYIKKNREYLVDPLGVVKLVEELELEIDTFDAEIDAVLSEANAITFIEV